RAPEKARAQKGQHLSPVVPPAFPDHPNHARRTQVHIRPPAVTGSDLSTALVTVPQGAAPSRGLAANVQFQQSSDVAWRSPPPTPDLAGSCDGVAATASIVVQT